MSLLQRKPRPLARDPDTFRDACLFIVACDDTYAPMQYFGFFKIPRIQVRVVPTKDGKSVAKHVLERLLEYDFEDGDELWMLLDTDHLTKGAHLAGFLTAIKDARRRGVNVAISNPCFELWLLLHQIDGQEIGELHDAKITEKKLRSVLGQYDKTNLKEEHYPLSSVISACARAKQLDATATGGDTPQSNVTRVYLLWEAIVAKSTPLQLPPELNQLRDLIQMR